MNIKSSMKKMFLKVFVLLITVYAFSATYSHAQNLPADLSNVHVADLSESQIRQLVQQADASGLTDKQLAGIAQQKGLPFNEAEALERRMSDIRSKTSRGTGNSGQVTDHQNITNHDDTLRSRRNLNFQADPDTLRNKTNDPFDILTPKVFGADLFKNSTLSFTPNLKLATPKNYVVGPDDQLNVSVYGNSLANWKIDVSPEGNINIPGAGILNVTGKTIEQATESIKSKLIANHYAIGHGTTLQVTLGNIRSIKVIMVGQLTRPGTYTLPSLATAFNALYAAGGPNRNGSYRQIEVIRNNRVVSRLDVYDFLLKGDQKNNIGLQDQDIIRVPTYRTHVEMAGEIKTPAIFEVLPGETLQDVIGFAGSFTDLAYTGKIKVLQINEQQRRITDVIAEDFKNYIPLRGDKYIVDKILDRYENRVTITGAVFRPGAFELEKGLTLSRLIAKASGLKEDAFTGRGSITRLKPDNSREMLSFNVRDIMNKNAADIILQREDSVSIASIFDLRDAYKVTIKGEVRKPGSFAYADSMKIADLIIMAGGFTEGASNKRIEVAQRINNSDPNSAGGQVAIVYSLNLDDKLDLSKTDFTLKPYDIVSVYGLPGYEKQRTVKVEGEVLYPGYYTIKTKNEKISDLVTRAGNLTILADADGSSLKRTNTAILGVDKNRSDSTSIQNEQLQRRQHLQRSFKDSTTTDERYRNNLIGINLKEIIERPGSVSDLILEDGDVLRIPKKQQVVRINGEVLFPSAVVFEKGKSFNDFVSNAGGYSPRALRSRAYVVYPNGTVKGTRKFLFFNAHPEVKPGSEIYVPKKAAPRPGSTQEVIGLTTGLASLGAIILGIISLHK